jgi:hypothetical protein
MVGEKILASCENCGLIFETEYILRWIHGDYEPKDKYCKKCERVINNKE